MAVIDFSSNPSLNEIVSSLAARANKPFDTGLMRELKHIVNYKRSKYIHEWLKESPAMREYFRQSFNANMEKAPASECENFSTNCYVIRTICEIPEPMRDNFIKFPHQLFDYVGSVSGYKAYSWMKPEHMFTMRYKEWTSLESKWFYMNRRIYVVNLKHTGPTVDLSEDRLDGNGDPNPAYKPTGYTEPAAIKVRGVWEDAFELQRCDVCNDNPSATCVSDDSPYSVPRELLSDIIIDILKNELRMNIPEDEVIEKGEAKTDSTKVVQHIVNER